MNENILAITRIRQHYGMLSQSEQKIADYIMENHQVIESCTTAELAVWTDTSPATIVRFCRSLGFKGFSDFKHYLSHEFLTPSAKWMNVEHDEAISGIKQKTFRFNQSSSDETMSLLNNEALEMAIEAINEASTVLIIGEGGSGSSARAGYDAFLKMGLNCAHIDDAIFQVLAISNLPKNAVVVCVCHSGQARNCVESMKVAKKKGITTIGLVGIVGSPLMKYTDIPLFTGVSEHPHFSDSLSARICELNVLSTIHAGLSLKRSDQVSEHRQEVRELMDMKRVKK